MPKFKIGQEIFYITRAYDELPKIVHGVIVDPPSNIGYPDLCNVRPMQYKDIVLTTVSRKEGEVFLTKEDVFPLLEKATRARVWRKCQEIATLESNLNSIRRDIRNDVP